MTIPPIWGHDPLLRWLRAIAVLALLAILAIRLADPTRVDNVEITLVLVGAILVALGYPLVMRLPAVMGTKDVELRLAGKAAEVEEEKP